jgi:uncharacterized membrane protein
VKDTKLTTNYFHRGDDLTRITALSDGLFATVLTILVLDLKPDIATLGPSQDLTGFLLALWPKIFNYTLTFVVTGLFWIGHHWIFEHIQVYNRRLLWLNLMFLFCVVLLPFTTALLGTSGIDLSIRWNLYAVVMIVISLTLMILWEYALAHQLTDPDLDARVLRYVRIRHAASPIVFFTSILFEPYLPGLVLYFPVLILPIYLIARKVLRKPVRSGLSIAGDEDRGGLKEGLWQIASFLPLALFAVLTVWMWLAGKK